VEGPHLEKERAETRHWELGIIELNLISSVPAAQKLSTGDHTKRAKNLIQTSSIKEQNIRTYERVKPTNDTLPLFCRKLQNVTPQPPFSLVKEKERKCLFYRF
jgi:hypothetical protein